MSNQSNYRYCNIKSLGSSSKAAIEQRILDMFSGLKFEKILPSSNCSKTKRKMFFKTNTKTPYYTIRSIFRTEHFVEYSSQNDSTDTRKFVVRIRTRASARYNSSAHNMHRSNYSQTNVRITAKYIFNYALPQI